MAGMQGTQALMEKGFSRELAGLSIDHPEGELRDETR